MRSAAPIAVGSGAERTFDVIDILPRLPKSKHNAPFLFLGEPQSKPPSKGDFWRAFRCDDLINGSQKAVEDACKGLMRV